MIKKREQKDFWDEHKNSRLESSPNKSNVDKSSLGTYNSDEKNLDERENIRDSIQEGLRDNNGTESET